MENDSENETPKSFREFHNEMRKYRRRVFVRTDKPPVSGYVRPKADGEIKGKAAKKAAKREKVKALKAAVNAKD